MATSPDPRPFDATVAPDGRCIIDELPSAIAVTAAERDLVLEYLASLVEELFAGSDIDPKG